MKETRKRLLDAGCIPYIQSGHIEKMTYHVDGPDAPPVVVTLDYKLNTVTFKADRRDTPIGFDGRLAYMLKGI